MSRDIFEQRSWLARVRTGGGRNADIAGTAFAIDARHLLTCAHVVTAVGEPGPGARLRIDLPFQGSRSCWTTVLEENWHPAPTQGQAKSQGDIALLQIDKQEADLSPLPITRRRPARETSISAYGFTKAHFDSTIAEGTLGRPVGLAWTRIEQKSQVWVDPGFSGGAVWSNDLRAAIGMVVAREQNDTRMAFAIPVEALAAASPIVSAALEGPPLHWLENMPAGLRDFWVDKRSFVAESTSDFIGRASVFEKIDGYLKGEKAPSGYILIEGEPGIGKTSIIAQLAMTRGYPHHFNVLTANQRSPKLFLGNICAQLIGRYDLNHEILPMTVGDNSVVLEHLLAEAVARGPQPVVLLVDALDEAEPPLKAGINKLFLPERLPEGCYIILTNRLNEALGVTHDNRHEPITIREDKESSRDIADYVALSLDRAPEACARLLQAWKATRAELIQAIVDKSEGNFMYVRNVLRDMLDSRIEDGSRPSLAESLKALPKGLVSYYDRHWKAMGMENAEEFRNLLAPIIFFMAAAGDAVPAREIADWINASGAFSPTTTFAVHDVLEGKWRQFVHVEEGNPATYRLYHRSFLEFLEKKKEIADYRSMLADVLNDQVDRNAAAISPLQ